MVKQTAGRDALDNFAPKFAEDTDSDLAAFAATLMFPVGEPNDAYAQYFSGKSWLAPLTAEQVPTANVTFEPGCRNNWHVHNADKGGGQMLICVGGRGYYQEWVSRRRRCCRAMS